MSKSLSEKLGLKPGMTSGALDLPDTLAEALPLARLAAGECADLIVAFVRDRAALADVAAAVLPGYRPGGRLWFAYPKKSGAIRSDISRDEGWEAVLAAGFLPVTQIALDDDWSALRFRPRAEMPKLTRKSGLDV